MGTIGDYVVEFRGYVNGYWSDWESESATAFADAAEAAEVIRAITAGGAWSNTRWRITDSSRQRVIFTRDEHGAERWY